MSIKKNQLEKLLTRRAVIVMAGQLGLLSVLAGRLVWVQGFASSDLRAKADGNNIKTIPLLTKRGIIFDRHGVILASNTRNLQVLIVPERSESISESLNKLSKYVEIPQHIRKKVLKKQKQNNQYKPIRILANLDWETFSSISLNLSSMQEVELTQGHIRYYPFSNLTSHVLGYVSTVSEREQRQSRDPMLNIADYQIGKTGIEKVYESSLRGKGGSRIIEVNARGKQVQQVSTIYPKPGKQLDLSLDIRVQQILSEQFDPYRRAAGVVMDVNTGEVIASVSKPSFDANEFSSGLNNNTWNLLLRHPDTPLTDKVISGQYAPGSTFKIVSLLAGLEYNVAQNLSTVCKGYFSLGKSVFHCWKKTGHGKVDVQTGFRWSCDVWYYTLAIRLGLNPMVSTAQKLGLGLPTGIELIGEKPGLIPTKEWRRKQYNKPWQDGETVINAIGQGFVLTTPLQLAQMVARVATGKAVKVTMEKKLNPAEIEFPKLDIRPENLSLIRQLMFDVVNAKDGTGRTAKIYSEVNALAGKTGTSQVRRITKLERKKGVIKNEGLDWLLRDHSVFVAFAPAYRPRWSISIVVEHAGSGSRVAAPIASRVMNYIQTIYPNQTEKKLF